jgi:hypoxanthine phosphoribosyltransferase
VPFEDLPPIQPLITADSIARRIAELGAAIEADYRGKSPILLCILKGSFIFAADLVRAVQLPLRVEFLGVQSYGDDTKSSGIVQITQDVTRPVRDEDVLIVEDIVDSGLTLSYIRDQLEARHARSVRVCALLHKPSRMQREVSIDYLGFTIEDVFVVGYGLDHAQRFRNLPYIGAIESPGGA